MDQTLTRDILELTYEADRTFVKMLRLVQERGSEKDFVAFRKKVAPLIADLFLEVMDPLFREHLDLVPDRYKDHYEDVAKVKPRVISTRTRRKK